MRKSSNACMKNLLISLLIVVSGNPWNLQREFESDSQEIAPLVYSPAVENEFLIIVKEYADAMIENGRDSYGSVHSPLFASTLSRQTLGLDPGIEHTKIQGVRKNDRSMTGANLIHDKDLYGVLFQLSDLIGEYQYAHEARKALKYFFETCQSETTGLMCWGEHLYWNFLKDECGHAPNYDFHETNRWPFWDVSYDLAPEACWRFVMGEWDHQIHDQASGDFSRHARWTTPETFSGFDFPRYAGQMIERWADAYVRSENAEKQRREELITAIEVLFNRMQENMKLSNSGYLIAGRSLQGDHRNLVWLTSNIELARCLQKTAPLMDDSLADNMKKFALKQDDDFLKGPHILDSVDGGFAVTLHAQTGLPRSRDMNKPYTSTWSSGYGYKTHAGVANICYQRHQNLKNEYPERALQYKKLTLKAAQQYLVSIPDTTQLLKPREVSSALELMLNCFDVTLEKRYLDRAVFFGELGLKLFFEPGNPLPKASNKDSHYESITGGPSLMRRFLRLHITMNQ
jgi:hypothetical protein